MFECKFVDWVLLTSRFRALAAAADGWYSDDDECRRPMVVSCFCYYGTCSGGVCERVRGGGGTAMRWATGRARRGAITYQVLLRTAQRPANYKQVSRAHRNAAHGKKTSVRALSHSLSLSLSMASSLCQDPTTGHRQHLQRWQESCVRPGFTYVQTSRMCSSWQWEHSYLLLSPGQ